MTVEIEIELNGMTDALVYYRSRRAIPVNNVALIWPREKSGRPLDKQPFRDCRILLTVHDVASQRRRE